MAVSGIPHAHERERPHELDPITTSMNSLRGENLSELKDVRERAASGRRQRCAGSSERTAEVDGYRQRTQEEEVSTQNGGQSTQKDGAASAGSISDLADSSDSHRTLRDQDGHIEALYHAMWAKNSHGEPCPGILVPDVVIYKHRVPAYWYFTGTDGKLKRKHRGSIANGKIFAEFTKGARSARDVVAYHISEGAGDTSKTAIEYLDTPRLRDFLSRSDGPTDGCLQRFVNPTGDRHSSMIQAAWSPQICLIERRVNRHRLDNARVPLQQRCCTYESEEHTDLSKIVPVRSCRYSRRALPPQPTLSQLPSQLTSQLPSQLPSQFPSRTPTRPPRAHPPPSSLGSEPAASLKRACSEPAACCSHAHTHTHAHTLTRARTRARTRAHDVCCCAVGAGARHAADR